MKPTSRSKSDPAVSYDEFKEYEGQKYTGMKIGRSHKWYYDQGEWKETFSFIPVIDVVYRFASRPGAPLRRGSGSG